MEKLDIKSFKKTQIADSLQTMRYTADFEKWTVEISVDKNAKVGGCIYRAGKGTYEGLMVLHGKSVHELLEDATRRLSPLELSLHPLDVGFDLRETGVEVALPYGNTDLTVRTGPTKNNPDGVKFRGTSFSVAHCLRGFGYVVSTERTRWAPEEIMASEMGSLWWTANDVNDMHQMICDIGSKGATFTHVTHRPDGLVDIFFDVQKDKVEEILGYVPDEDDWLKKEEIRQELPKWGMCNV